ncbi:MAG: hypothetical protein H6850_02455 [Alphaproteobacteria bacterium]|nr:MAG: hypothetical protein H6850_02455 [Alphaproteobacteria bacterium]
MNHQNNEPFCDACDLFESKNNTSCNTQQEDRWFTWVKIGTLVCSVLMVVGIAGYVIKQATHKKTDQPIVIYAPTEPLKVQPEVEIIEERAVPKKENHIYQRVKKKQQVITSKKSTVAPVIAPPVSASYYISLGTFESHEGAYAKWEKVKGDYFNDFRDIEPIIRVVPLKSGKGYQLMAGPVNKQKGLRLADKFKSTLLSVND